MAEEQVEIQNNTEYLFEVELEDGCIFIIDTPNDRSNGWEVTFPAGFTVRCPHGLVFDSHSLPKKE